MSWPKLHSHTIQIYFPSLLKKIGLELWKPLLVMTALGNSSFLDSDTAFRKVVAHV